MFLPRSVQVNLQFGRSYIKCFSSYSTLSTPMKNMFTKSAPKSMIFANKNTSFRPLCVATKAISLAQETSASKEDREGFKSALANLIQDFTESDQYSDITEVMQNFGRFLDYNIGNCDLKRVHVLMDTYRAIENSENLTAENIRLAYILGCCLEMIQASLFIPDDVVQGAKNRRGLKCWYLNEEVGLTAANDTLTVLSAACVIARKYFHNLRCSSPILELLNDISLKATLGQTLNNISVTSKNLESFTTERWKHIVKYRKAYVDYQFPMSAAFYLANIFDPKVHKAIQPIILQLARQGQAENDINDCYANGEAMLGADIRQGKYTWLIAEALGRASPQQKKLLKENYGKPDQKSEQVVRNLYDEIGILNHYYAQKEEGFKATRSLIEQRLSGPLQKMMFGMLKNVYGKQSLSYKCKTL